MIFLDSRERRSLWILMDGPATEAEGRPLETLERAVEFGLAEYTEFKREFGRGKWFSERKVKITEKGKQFLKEIT